MNTKRILIGIFSGLAAGAIIGILFAPYKGSETRKKIIEQGDDYTDLVKEKFNEYSGIINDKFENVKKEISDYIDSIKEKISELKTAKKATMN